MYDPSLWAISIAQGVQAGAMGKMAQEEQEARKKMEEREKKLEASAAKASEEGILFSPFGQEKILSVDFDAESKDILFYTANGIYRVSAESDFADKKLFVLRYFDSFDPELNCHVIHLDEELKRIFPRGWRVEGRLIDGRKISFSSSDIDGILNNKRIREEQIESLNAKLEEELEEDIEQSNGKIGELESQKGRARPESLAWMVFGIAAAYLGAFLIASMNATAIVFGIIAMVAGICGMVVCGVKLSGANAEDARCDAALTAETKKRDELVQKRDELLERTKSKEPRS